MINRRLIQVAKVPDPLFHLGGDFLAIKIDFHHMSPVDLLDPPLEDVAPDKRTSKAPPADCTLLLNSASPCTWSKNDIGIEDDMPLAPRVGRRPIVIHGRIGRHVDKAP